jgi:UDP-glucose 4-epimerase
LLEIGIRSWLKGFINTGTFFEYDCSIQPINEHAAPAPFNLYAKTKLAFESILKSYSDQLAINTFKLFSPYGEKDNIKLIPMVIQKALNHEKVQLSDGMQKLDFTYVGDIVEAYVKAIDRMVLNDGLTGYSVFNLGSGVPVSIREVVSVIQQNVGEVINVDWGEPSAVDIPIAYADISKIKTELSWSPQYSIHAGIANTIEYYRTRMKNGV